MLLQHHTVAARSRRKEKIMISWDSEGNGAFVTITWPDGRSVFLQGDDAARFLDDIEGTLDDDMEQWALSQYDVIAE